MKDRDRIDFAVKFAQADLANLREGDWLNLREDILAFVTNPSARGVVMMPTENDLSREDFKSWQKDVYAIFAGLAAHRGIGDRGTRAEQVKTQVKTFSIPTFPVNTKMGVSPFGNSALVMFSGPVRDLFLYRLSLLLDQDPSRIFRCKSPDCDRIFFRIRKQKYCSPRCQTREFMRTWRKDNEGNESELNHKRYKNRVEKTRGRPTKVARRQTH